jgi:hypothetical protein
MNNMDRLEEVVARLPDAARVDVEAWDGEPTFRVSGKTFIFSAPDATGITVKLAKEEAAAAVVTVATRVSTRVCSGCECGGAA